jgi:hypothetical protein
LHRVYAGCERAWQAMAARPDTRVQSAQSDYKTGGARHVTRLDKDPPPSRRATRAGTTTASVPMGSEDLAAAFRLLAAVRRPNA